MIKDIIELVLKQEYTIITGTHVRKNQFINTVMNSLKKDGKTFVAEDKK